MDVSREMLNIARQRAAKLSMDVSFSLADAAALPFSDRSFDTLGIERKQIHWGRFAMHRGVSFYLAIQRTTDL